MRTIILTHKTSKGKQKLKQYGNKWKVLKSVPTVEFSNFVGPWLQIEPIKLPNLPRWIHKDNDKNFLITLDTKETE